MQSQSDQMAETIAAIPCISNVENYRNMLHLVGICRAHKLVNALVLIVETL